MVYRFGAFRLDPVRFELSLNGQAIAVEPQVLKVLLHLVRHRNRMVPKSEIVEEVWSDRAVSDASISSRVRLARKALGDDGERQEFIRTVHGLGFRFVAPVTEEDPPTLALPALGSEVAHGRPSIAVLPLRPVGLPFERAVLADAVSHDVIQALSRLRWLAVIARGSSFHFRGVTPDVTEVGTALGVRYVLSGLIEAHGACLSAMVELTECVSGSVLWADRLTVATDAVEELRALIVARVVGALESYIPLNEAMAAQLRSTEHLDAWANYHLGLQHMYRFTAGDNVRATGYFEQAIALDPSFARAHGGLSFTCFQEAFLRYARDPGAAVQEARRHAERGLEIDPLDPFVCFNMGRAFWLVDQLEAAAGWLDRATELNPNYAQGYYSRAFTAMLAGDHAVSAEGVSAALRLSPLDPLRYGMLGTRSLSLTQAGRYDEAADWSDKAASAPSAHFLISMIALVANALAGRDGQAQLWLGDIRARRPGASAQHFFAAFPIHDVEARQQIMSALAKFGL